MVGGASALALALGAHGAPTLTTAPQTDRTSNSMEGTTKTQTRPQEAQIWTEEG